MLTLTQRIEAGADRRPRPHLRRRWRPPSPVPYGQLHEEARGLRRQPPGARLGPGDHVALLGPTSRPLVTAIQAIWLAGATVVVLPLPMRLSSIEEFVAQTRVRITNADVVARARRPRAGAVHRARPGDPPMVGWDASAGPGRRRRRRLGAPADDLERLAILQFTSGSTSDPKGVMLPHRTVGANLDAIAHGDRRSTPTTTCSCRGCRCTTTWGWSGCFTPLAHHRHAARARRAHRLHGRARPLDGVDVDLRRHRHRRPELLLRARRPRPAAAATPLDLSRLRIALNGAEPVDPATVAAFVDAGRAPRPATRARCSRPSAWRRSRSPARSRSRCPGCAPTPSTCGCSRPSATRPR